MGFEKFLDITEFKNPNYKGSYISEESTINKIIEVYKDNLKTYPDNPLFNFTITIQNHGPYLDKYSANKNFNTNLNLNNKEINELSNYFEFLKNSNMELKKLINFFNKENKPVIILYFEDHLPLLSQGIYNKFYPNIYKNETLNDIIKLYKTPFIIW